MSYCVNCGVKLEETLNKCPLCNTPIINPNELKKIRKTIARMLTVLEQRNAQ